MVRSVKRLICVVGPTASGKSALGVELAVRLGGEVVNADASQLYRSMDIGTAKMTDAECRGVPHHQLDVLDIDDRASVAAYQRYARNDISTIESSGKTALLVGGSGLYIRAVIDPLEFPGTDPTVRRHWDQKLDEHGSLVLHGILRERDPAAAEAILPSNGRRIVRALEVIDLTGRPFSATMPEYCYVRPTVQLGLMPDRDVLDERISNRVYKMLDDGFVAEVQRLREAGLDRAPTSSRALGYQQMSAYLRGECSLEQAVDDTIVATRKFARRQMSWFRRDTRVIWLESARGANPKLSDMVDEGFDVLGRAS